MIETEQRYFKSVPKIISHKIIIAGALAAANTSALLQHILIDFPRVLYMVDRQKDETDIDHSKRLMKARVDNAHVNIAKLVLWLELGTTEARLSVADNTAEIRERQGLAPETPIQQM